MNPTQRSALGQPDALDSAHPAPDPPHRAPHGVRPRGPGKDSATTRTTAPPQYLSHVPRLSVKMPVLAPERSPLSPCAHAAPPEPVWSGRLGALPRGRSVAARPALPHGACPGSYRHRRDSPSAAASSARGPRPRAARLRRRRLGPEPRGLTRHQHELCAACVGCNAGLDPAGMNAAPAVRKNRT